MLAVAGLAACGCLVVIPLAVVFGCIYERSITTRYCVIKQGPPKLETTLGDTFFVRVADNESLLCHNNVF